ncbi:Dabb family protein [Cohnella sp. CFH 77786]|uniref:Dabb family protein n=1 Tax=Cohnella sp. CFH 77786 TaxID=2662265 RepID=UPI001C60F7A9|nr:Dabb family protein [Cohnella sp. CFH 77786]MBW5445038.1 Dabb family protein [Cohnella sp. CFH 77786]
MITHIVLFKLKDRSPENIERTAQVLRDMEGKIEELLFIEVGIDVVHSERSYDIALTTRFESLEALQAYQVHPVHQKVIEHMSRVRESSISVDYEN